jgi:hypothetical protein
MIIHNLNVVGIPVMPNKADAPLIVDADAVLSFPVLVEGFQAISWWRRQVAQLSGNVQLPKFSLRHSLESTKLFHPLPGMKPFRIL